MFDTLIREAGDRFGLGDKARPFVGMLLGLLFNPGSDGFNGLRQRFANNGMGDLFGGWIGSHVADNVLQPDQFMTAVGENQVHAWASRLGVPNAAVSLAGATLLPKLIGLLTQGGHVPTNPPADAVALINAASTPHTPTTHGGHTAAPPHRLTPAEVPARGSGWLKWVIVLAIILLALLLMRGCKREPEALPPPAPATESTATEAPVAQTNAVFQLTQAGGKATVSGQVPSEADKTRLWEALAATFGAANLSGDLRIDPATLPPGWMDALITALPSLKADGLRLGFNGDSLEVDTSALSEDQRFALSDTLRRQFGGFAITGLWDRAAAALSGLKAGFSSADLVTALNLMNIYFDTGSATITRDSQETLSAAAKAIAQAPEGTRIEVGGHTDNTGDAAANQTLSQQRADAVVARLGELGTGSAQFTAKGYGQDKPRADNSTEDGKAQNRRIEFTVAE